MEVFWNPYITQKRLDNSPGKFCSIMLEKRACIGGRVIVVDGLIYCKVMNITCQNAVFEGGLQLYKNWLFTRLFIYEASEYKQPKLVMYPSSDSPRQL